MSIDILDSLNSVFGNQLTRSLSGVLGDSEESTRAGLRAGVPALLAGLVQKSTQPGGPQDLYRTVTGSNIDPAFATRLGSLLDTHSSLDSVTATGESLLSSIFGNRTSGVANAVAEVAGLRPSSASGLLALAAPMLFGWLKKYVTQNNLDASGLGSVLLNQRSTLQRLGLDSRITNAMGIPNLQSVLGSTPGRVDTGTTARPTYEPAPPAASIPVKQPQRRWIPWAVAAAVALLAFGFVSNRLGRHGSTTTASALPASVYFDAGQAALTPEDRRTIAAVASSVRGRDAPLSVTGYTDSSGNTDQNMELAKNRAAAVRDALVQEGVPKSRVLMTPPAAVTGTGTDQDARRVEIKLATADTATQR
jgi:outer membrane protein OmpA-like peptidoglycan-associated protein